MPLYTNAIMGWKNAPYKGSSVKNCASCTAAGAVNLTLGSTQILSSAAGMQMGDSTTEQALAIAAFVEKGTGRTPAVTNGELALGDAELWMQSFPNRTVFAVCASGYCPHDEDNKCHWLNAILAGGTIRYFDFQSNRESKAGGQFLGSANPATSRKPFVGVITQSAHGATSKQMHNGAQAGSFDAGVKLQVVAFPPKIL